METAGKGYDVTGVGREREGGEETEHRAAPRHSVSSLGSVLSVLASTSLRSSFTLPPSSSHETRTGSEKSGVPRLVSFVHPSYRSSSSFIPYVILSPHSSPSLRFHLRYGRNEGRMTDGTEVEAGERNE